MFIYKHLNYFKKTPFMTSEIDLPVIHTTVSTSLNESSSLMKNKKSYPQRLYTLDEDHAEMAEYNKLLSLRNHSCHLPPFCSIIIFFMVFGGALSLILFLPTATHTEYTPAVNIYNESLSVGLYTNAST